MSVAALVVATVLTRVPFMTRSLYAFDSANYALAVRDFYNVTFHQPHPPGYPLYVFIASGLYRVIGDANTALVLEGIVWSAIAVGCAAVLARWMFGPTVGLLSGALLLATVGFWGYGEVAYPYVALAGETASIALLAHLVISGNRRALIPMAAIWAISLGTRWDAAVFDVPLAWWALASARWRLRGAAVVLSAAIVVAWAAPMVMLSGGPSVYLQTLSDYLKVWAPQSAYVVGDFASGGDTQAAYNLNFLVNYLRQMLGIGLILVLYLLGRRFSPVVLASDYRSRFLALWIVPPLITYVFAHLGEPGYVLSLAPQAATLIALAIFDLHAETTLVARVLHARGWRWLPTPRVTGLAVASALAVAIVGWNVQAFARGVGPGRLPDLRAHDATTLAQIEYLKQQDPATTLVLAHDVFRQLHYYVPNYRADLLFSEYVPDFQTAVTRSDLGGIARIVVLDSPLKLTPDDARQANEVLLRDQPHVSVWVVNPDGATAVEHGYHSLRLIR